MKRSLLTIGLAAGLLMLPSAGSGTLAQCTGSNMCMWGNNGFDWLIGQRSPGVATVTNLSATVNDKMDSWANKSSSYRGCMYSNANGGGDRQLMSPVSNDDNVAPWNSDQVSSWRTRNAC